MWEKKSVQKRKKQTEHRRRVKQYCDYSSDENDVEEYEVLISSDDEDITVQKRIQEE